MAQGMTEKEMAAFIDRVQSILKLSDWRIRLKIGDCPSDCWAQVRTTPNYKKATIRVNSELVAGLCTESIPAILIHELLHCYHAAAVQALERVLPPSDKKNELIWQMVTDIEESIIEPMSEVIAHLMEEKHG